MSLERELMSHTAGMENSLQNPRSATGGRPFDRPTGIDKATSSNELSLSDSRNQKIIQPGGNSNICDNTSAPHSDIMVHNESLNMKNAQMKNDAEDSILVCLEPSEIANREIIDVDNILKTANPAAITKTFEDDIKSDYSFEHSPITNSIDTSIPETIEHSSDNVNFDQSYTTIGSDGMSYAADRLSSPETEQKVSFVNNDAIEHNTDATTVDTPNNEIDSSSVLFNDEITIQSSNSEPNGIPIPSASSQTRDAEINLDQDLSVMGKDLTTNVSNMMSEKLICTNSHEYNEILQSELPAINIEHSRNISRSILSLNLHGVSENDKLNKSPMSKSVENISLLNTCLNQTDSNLNGIDNINQEMVLAEFDAHKSKVPLPKGMPADPTEKFQKSHKETITQDFGSMFKNVHGIFSSVSGSLKHAYNISQRMPVQSKVINMNKILTTGSLKNTTNGKIMNDIFEIDQSETNRTAGPDSIVPNSNESSPKKELKNSEEGSYYSGTDSNRDFSIAEEDKLESLERALSAERLEVVTLRERLRHQAEEMLEKERERKNAETKMESLRRRLECSEREKDGAVMRYATSESAAIGAREAVEAARRVERAARAESELLAGKLRSAHAEKQRICQIYDDKCHEVETAGRETARLKEELKELEGKLRWTQSKLRTEMDAYKEAAAQAERLTQQVSELEAARDSAAAHMEDSARARQLEAELEETRASLILTRHESEELDRRFVSSSRQLESCRKQLADAAASLARLQAQTEELTASNQRLEEEAAELASLRVRAALADTLAQQLERETERARRAEEERGRERARAETCARREAAALEHAARLTAEHVGERAQHRRREAEARALGADNAGLREKLSSLEVELTGLRAQVADEAARRRSECQLLARKVAELTEELQESGKRLEWEKGENVVLKKKHASTLRELNRELQRSLKRCEQLEARAEPPASTTPTGSVSSLSGSDSPGGGGGTLPPPAPPADLQPERQALIERIVQLQRAGARRAERCDFLEEHNRQLTAELRDKARLLRQLLASQPAGALADNTADEHKREMARLGGGAMSALWGGAPDGVTLELSLEMNRKLQAVLEDALLKNITLKNSMNTLGAEIARLKANKDSA